MTQTNRRLEAAPQQRTRRLWPGGTPRRRGERLYVARRAPRRRPSRQRAAPRRSIAGAGPRRPRPPRRRRGRRQQHSTPTRPTPPPLRCLPCFPGGPARVPHRGRGGADRRTARGRGRRGGRSARLRARVVVAAAAAAVRGLGVLVRGRARRGVSGATSARRPPSGSGSPRLSSYRSAPRPSRRGSPRSSWPSAARPRRRPKRFQLAAGTRIGHTGRPGRAAGPRRRRGRARASYRSSL
mmetsp:Transcript_7038/g.17324  ORF Transcript_7038/g.17324 Transcript_7038/m.17324 type:complete len:239 (+) Transcript_7038:552-1268(+)